MGSLSAAALILRRVRKEAGILLLLFALVATTSFLFAVAPRLLNRATDDAMRYALASASPVDRDISMTASGSIAPGNQGGVSAVQAYGQQRQADFAPSIERLVSGRSLGITSVRLAVQQSIVSLSLRYQDGLTDAARLASGRWPIDLGTPLRQINFGQQIDPGAQPPPIVVEAALSTTEAETIGVHLGDYLDVGLDRSDPLVPPTAYQIAPTQLEVVGLYDPIDANADDWVGTGLLQTSFKRSLGDIIAIYATAYVPAEAYHSLAVGLLPFHYDWRYQIDPALLNADQIESLQPDLRSLALVASTTDRRVLADTKSVVSLSGASINSGMLGILEGFSEQRARSESVLSIAALGPIGLAVAAIAMVAILLIRPRRGSLLLARGRGASGALLLGVQLLETILIAGTAALVGLVLAVYVVPAREAPLSSVLALGVAVVSTLLLVAATWPTARRPLVQLERDDPRVLRVSPRRLVIEATIVGLAIAAVYLLRQRGLTLGQAGDTVSFDPLLAAVPLLSGLAVGIVAMRLYPLPIRGLGWLAARRRDLVPVVGLRTVARRPATANLPLLVLMLTAAFAAFASVVETSIDRGQIAASYLEVGADYRLEAVGIGSLPASLDPTTIPGVDAVASGFIDSTAAFVNKTNQRAGVNLEAIDADALTKVTAQTMADPKWPNAFLAPPVGQDVGTDANPIPAIVSSQFPSTNAYIGPGDRFTMVVARQPLIFRLVQRGAGISGLGDPPNFAIVPLDWVRAALPDTPLAPTVMFLRAPNGDKAPLTQLASAVSGGIRIVARQDAYAALHDAPLGSAVADGFGVAVGIGILYLALTLVGAVIISAAGRTRDLAYLRTLGVSARQALGLTTVENAPPVLLALIPGVLLGVGVAILVEPGLGLATFVGAPGLPLFVDWPTLVLVIVALSAVVIVAILAGSWLAGRSRLASALRIGDS